MTVHVKVAGVWKDVTAPSIRPAGSFVDVTEIHVKVAGVWKEAFSASVPLALNVTPASINEFDLNCPLTSQLITATASGGEPPYSYSWTWQTGGGGITILSPTSLSTRVRVSVGGSKSGTLRCIVTDQQPDTAQDTCAVVMECGGL